MTSLALACLLICVAADPPVQRAYHEIENDMKAALRREASAKDLAQRGAAVRELAALFTELRRDPRTPTSGFLREDLARIRARLVSVQNRLKREIARSPTAAGSQNTPRDIEGDERQQELAQQIAAQVSLASYSLGGPARLFDSLGGAPGGGAVIADHGQELVDLIQRTIAPAAWDVNGGPCTIVYYRPLMCLVVTATGDIHGQAGNLLQGLRRP
jgi:hypothetical protein